MGQQLECRSAALFTRCLSATIVPWQFMTQLGRFNASEGYVYRVTGAALFDSMLSDAEHSGGVSIAIELEPRTADDSRSCTPRHQAGS